MRSGRAGDGLDQRAFEAQTNSYYNVGVGLPAVSKVLGRQGPKETTPPKGR